MHSSVLFGGRFHLVFDFGAILFFRGLARCSLCGGIQHKRRSRCICERRLFQGKKLCTSLGCIDRPSKGLAVWVAGSVTDSPEGGPTSPVSDWQITPTTVVSKSDRRNSKSSYPLVKADKLRRDVDRCLCRQVRNCWKLQTHDQPQAHLEVLTQALELCWTPLVRSPPVKAP
jgi:hypothetical protein